jgi:hypothetical protein
MPMCSPGRVVAVAVALTLLAAAPSPAAGQVRESRDWKRVRAGELLVVGNAGPEELRRAATNIQEFAGDRAGAVEHLRWVKDRGSRNYVEYPMAVAELEQLERPRR